jgi:broad specificity phosphatase PhoE
MNALLLQTFIPEKTHKWALHRKHNRADREDSSKYTLYLIRHGEAGHNVVENEAKKKALNEALEEGYELDSPETLRRVEEARRIVLHDPTLFDSPLSKQGEEQVRKSHKRLKDLSLELPPPTEILVSPLERTLQTADILFPGHTNIRVREQLRERNTGLACDKHQNSEDLRKRLSFQRFSMDQLQSQSILDNVLSGLQDKELGEGLLHGNSDHYSDHKMTIEDKEALRNRTKILFQMLASSKHQSIAVVTHKGYLRELERGQLGGTDATEFANGEVRVYEVTISNRTLDALKARRLR